MSQRLRRRPSIWTAQRATTVVEPRQRTAYASQARCVARLVRTIAVLCCSLCPLLRAPCVAQSTSVAEMQQHKSEWAKYAADERRFQIHGRFQGRTADTFKLEKFDIPCRLPSSIKLPDRMRASQRLELSGRFVSENDKFLFQVSKIAVRNTDAEQLQKLAESLPDSNSAALFRLADEYQADAEFYQDENLIQEIRALRTRGVEIERKQAKASVEQLEKVFEHGVSLMVDARLLSLIRFEILHLLSKQAGSDLELLLTRIRQADEGWDRQVPEVPPRLVNAFDTNAVAAYEAGTDEDRHWLQRLLYMRIRMKQINSMLKPDGSNGLALAALVRDEFPAESGVADALEEREMRYQLARVAQLSRQEIQDLSELLIRRKKSDQVAEVVQSWLDAQEKKFGGSQLVRLLRTADEYLFAAEKWKSTDYETRAIGLLKQAWFLASSESPTDAAQIADRLKRFGWEQLNGQWMTSQQLEALPGSDIQMAVREGRVVRGMSADQVIQILGRPARVSRLASSRVMRELWIYDAKGEAGLVVRFRRNLVDASDQDIVEDVSRISAAR
jgi:hypothetical protein